jgi:SH3-like domain-containing protein
MTSTPNSPRVVHLKSEPYDVRIDRQTHWGNSFVIGKDGTREQVIAKYRAWIMAPEQAHMIEYARKVLRGKTLGCWCAPKACHGDILLEIAND